MRAFYADEQKRHDPKAFLSSGAPQPNPEKPERVERLRGYSVNIVGSLAGVVAFAALSYLEQPPAVWLAAGLLPLLPAARSVRGCRHAVRPSCRRRTGQGRSPAIRARCPA